MRVGSFKVGDNHLTRSMVFMPSVGRDAVESTGVKILDSLNSSIVVVL